MSFIIDDILNLKKFLYLTITIMFYFLCIFIYHSFIYIYLASVWVVMNDMYEWQTWWNRWYCSTNYTEKVISSIASICVLFVLFHKTCLFKYHVCTQIFLFGYNVNFWVKWKIDILFINITSFSLILELNYHLWMLSPYKWE